MATSLMATVLMDRRARNTASQRSKRACQCKEDREIANKRRRDARAARSEELRHAVNLARSQERATVPEEEHEAANQSRREDYAAQPEELCQDHDQARPSDRDAFFLRLRALPPFISRMRNFAMPSHHIRRDWHPVIATNYLYSDRHGHSVPLHTFALATPIPSLQALFVV